MNTEQCCFLNNFMDCAENLKANAIPAIRAKSSSLFPRPVLYLAWRTVVLPVGLVLQLAAVVANLALLILTSPFILSENCQLPEMFGKRVCVAGANALSFLLQFIFADCLVCSGKYVSEND